MTRRGCGRRCELRKQQLEELTQYEELLDMEPAEAAEKIKTLYAYCERRHETALLLKASNDALQTELADTKKRLNAMIDQETYWRRVAQWSARNYVALDDRCRGFLQRAWAAEKVLSTKTQVIGEINTVLDWFESVRDSANTRADLECLNGLALFKIGRVVGHKYKEEKKC